MGILIIAMIGLLLAGYGDLCAEMDRRAVEIALLQDRLNQLEYRLRVVEQLPDMSVPAQRLAYLMN